MPCYEPPFPDPARGETDPLSDKLARTEAMLCAMIKLVRSLDGNDISTWDIDWKEAGIDMEELAWWWTEHRAKDKQK